MSEFDLFVPVARGDSYSTVRFRNAQLHVTPLCIQFVGDARLVDVGHLNLLDSLILQSDGETIAVPICELETDPSAGVVRVHATRVRV
jgi:hypothetical protein